MAYDRDEILLQAIEAIESNQVRKVTELVAYLPISRDLFYDWKFDKLDIIKEKIQQEKIKRKAALRKKWISSEAPALQIAAYKLDADEEEQDILNTSKIKSENTHKILMPDIVEVAIHEGKD